MTDTIDLNIYPVRDNSTNVNRLKVPISPVLPDLEKGFVLGLIMPRGSGKGTIIANLLLSPNFLNRENFQHAFIFSPTVFQDLTAAPLREYFKTTLYPKYDDSVISDIITYQKAYDEESRPRQIIVLDDNVGTRTKYLDALITRARHYKVMGIIVSTQALRQVAKVARSNFTDVCIGRTYNQKEWYALYEEYGALFGSMSRFKRMYDYATDKRFSFLYLKLNVAPPRAYKNFTEDITNKFPHDDSTVNFEQQEQQQMSENDFDADEPMVI